MPKSQLVAKIKRMDVTNKIQRKHWKQMIGITLGEIALNDENLLAIRKFRPNEEVLVTITPVQRDMAEEMDRIKKANPVEGVIPEEKRLSDLPENPLDLLIEEENGRDVEGAQEEEDQELATITVLTEGEEDILGEGEEVSKSFEF
ncbi:hypothetical protein [Isachenkonia alkalipeptolytica]|uniref:Uncharacterized protein n=1 Tax=Isachenkonia alkalipeptolytica TaxID=2565777 RepID=A0AA43XKP1_9CLOT|nr:hypothetical protein [Isachenkonia alkalipeptolytica]NBG88645.1 hypothetical protein [Isachenkonia alkalipeptolytica]